MALASARLKPGAYQISGNPVERKLQVCCSPFDKLRANGSGVEIAEDFPFVLSLSKHVSGHLPALPEI
jgi:hypothetical protein